jgi:hypothetical protein
VLGNKIDEDDGKSRQVCIAACVRAPDRRIAARRRARVTGQPRPRLAHTRL